MARGSECLVRLHLLCVRVDYTGVEDVCMKDVCA